VERSGHAVVAPAAVKNVGQLPGGRFTGAAGDAGRADRQTGWRSAAGGRGESAGQTADDATGSGTERGAGLVLTLGEVSRFLRGKQVASYRGLIPREETSGGRQKLGAITKQGNRLLRSPLVEAAQIAVRYDPEFRREYLHRCHAKPKAVAKVAAARELAVRLYWMLRTNAAYPEVVSQQKVVRIESSSRVPLVGVS
jgi:Transposase IS116/IS110/IS902 family